MPPEKQPPLPEWEFARCRPIRPSSPSACRNATGCKPSEGGIDSSHVSFLHRGDLGSDPLFKGAKATNTTLPTCSRISRSWSSRAGSISAPGATPRNGNYYCASRPGDALLHHDPAGGDHPITPLWIPIDDENCWLGATTFIRCAALTGREVDAMRDGAGRALQSTPPAPIGRRQQGQRLSDRPAAQKAGKTSAASPALRSRTPRCRRAWDRPATAPRRTSFPPTTGSSWRATA